MLPDSPKNSPRRPAGWPSRWLATWRDRRLSGLPDRAFCRRIRLEGFESIARASDSGSGLLVLCAHGPLPRTLERALRLFAGALPLAAYEEARAREVLAAGGLLFAPENSPSLPWLSRLESPRLLAQAEALAAGALIKLALVPS